MCDQCRSRSADTSVLSDQDLHWSLFLGVYMEEKVKRNQTGNISISTPVSFDVAKCTQSK